MMRRTAPAAAAVWRSGSSMTGFHSPLGQLGRARCGLRQAEQRLGGHHHQRPELLVEALAAKEVEVLGCGGGIGDPDVPLRPQGEEPLQPGAGVLRALALVAVGQEEGQARGLPPLGQPGDDELVHHDLGAVHEVAELRLPQDEGVGHGHRVAVLEPEAGVLAQGGVVDLEAGLGAIEVLHRGPGRIGLGIHQDLVALAERAAHGVLAGEPDRDAVAEQGGEGE